MNENQENNVLVGVILGGLATIGIITGLYFANKHDLIGNVKRKYFEWNDNSEDNE